MRIRVLLAAAGLLLTAAGHANTAPGGDAPVMWSLGAGAVYQGDTSLDEGGDVSVARFFISGGPGKVYSGGRWRVSAALGYGEDHYDFSGSEGFGALQPWDRVREVRLSAPLRYFGEGRWSYFAIPSLRWNAESGADLGDGFNGGLLAAAAYKVSDTLTIGPGFGVFSELEDSPSIFPILLVDWQLTEKLSLETGRGFAASRGPGIQLRWRSDGRWQFAFGGRYEKTRFRLDDSGPAPEGIGEDRAVPLFALADYVISRETRFSLIGGVEVGGTLRLEDQSGDRIAETDLDPAPFLGATFQTRF